MKESISLTFPSDGIGNVFFNMCKFDDAHPALWGFVRNSVVVMALVVKLVHANFKRGVFNRNNVKCDRNNVKCNKLTMLQASDLKKNLETMNLKKNDVTTHRLTWQACIHRSSATWLKRPSTILPKT